MSSSRYVIDPFVNDASVTNVSPSASVTLTSGVFTGASRSIVLTNALSSTTVISDAGSLFFTNIGPSTIVTMTYSGLSVVFSGSEMFILPFSVTRTLGDLRFRVSVNGTFSTSYFICSRGSTSVKFTDLQNITASTTVTSLIFEFSSPTANPYISATAYAIVASSSAVVSSDAQRMYIQQGFQQPMFETITLSSVDKVLDQSISTKLISASSSGRSITFPTMSSPSLSGYTLSIISVGTTTTAFTMLPDSGHSFVLLDGTSAASITSSPGSSYSFMYLASTGVWQETMLSGTATIVPFSGVFPLQHITTNLTVTTSNYYISVDTSSSSITVTLIVSPTNGRTYYIWDCAGNADVKNITVDGNGKLINGNSTLLITRKFQSVTVTFDASANSGTGAWFVI